MLTTTDKGLLNYLNQIMEQMGTWLVEGDVQRFVLVVSGIDSGETLERWQFNVSVEDDAKTTRSFNINDENISRNISQNDINSADVYVTKPVKKNKKSIKEIHNEIQAIIKQITASVSSYFHLAL